MNILTVSSKHYGINFDGKRKSECTLFCCRCFGIDVHIRESFPLAEPPPWDDWDLDPNFFTALSRWTIKHPDSSLDRVFENICVGIDSGKSLFELIPNSPFPARGLIGALGHLVKLGAVSGLD